MNTFQKELAVAFSRRAQPWWFRVLKWIVLIGVATLLRDSAWFWAWIIGTPMLGVGVHFFYRYKTRGWTHPWGGWNDVPAIGSDR